ncbi:MAG: hypothetical protein GXY83_23910 [Rhodopirellula sp.]|nr:hypothetical protein [Rhodopirellula sp.]
MKLFQEDSTEVVWFQPRPSRPVCPGLVVKEVEATARIDAALVGDDVPVVKCFSGRLTLPEKDAEAVAELACNGLEFPFPAIQPLCHGLLVCWFRISFGISGMDEDLPRLPSSVVPAEQVGTVLHRVEKALLPAAHVRVDQRDPLCVPDQRGKVLPELIFRLFEADRMSASEPAGRIQCDLDRDEGVVGELGEFEVRFRRENGVKGV